MLERRIIFIVLGLIILCAAFWGMVRLQRMAKVAEIISDEARWDFLDSLSTASRMKVVILDDGHVARFRGEDENSFFCDIQDDFSVPKSKGRIEMWSASDGKGWISLKEFGHMPAYSEPDPSSPVAGYLIFDRGDCPEVYSCLGQEDGWYKIDINGQPAYVEAKYAGWDAICSF